MSGVAVQNALTHVPIALALGAAIEGVLPPYNETATLRAQVVELAVQVGLNGLALGYLAHYLAHDDPTYGIPFSMALIVSQQELWRRMLYFSSRWKASVAQASLLMAARMGA